jgi:benzylsuccinate CoA-transferase BbsF subunit
MAQLSGQPLAGIRVLDFSHVLAGPVCTRLLADLGAEVLRVETGKRADTPWRSASDPDLKRTLAYVMVHRGKKSMTLDLKSNLGVDLARRLACVADVVVENFSAGVMTRLGLDFKQLEKINPRLIFLSMSGYGHNGPRKEWTSMNTNLQAYSGMMTVTEEEGNPPVAISNSWMDYVGGLHGCFSVLQALSKRARDGKGRHIDLAQFECGVGTLGSLLLAAIVDGTTPRRVGNRSSKVAPQGCYRCAGEDQWCVISVENDAQWQAFIGTLGHPAWTKNPRYKDLVGRLRDHDEIDRRIEDWTKALTNLDVEQRLRAVGVPAERMRKVDEILRDPTVFHLLPGNTQTTLMTGLPFSFKPHRPQTFGPAPRLGQHTAEALTDWLKLEPGEMSKLQSAGVLV